jgi:hypothetical protein
MSDLLNSIVNWPFLNEPAYRWAIFFFGMSFFLAGWNGVLEFMK